MILAGLDLGSRHVAISAAVGPLPLSAIDGETIEVDPENPLGAVDELLYFLEGYGPSIVVVEWGRFYVSAKDDPRKTAVTASAIGNNRDAMQEIRIPFESKCRELGIEIVHVPAMSWRARIRAKSDGDVRYAVNAIVGDELAAKIKDTHQYDSLGALLGYLIAKDAEQAREHQRSELKPRAKKETGPRPDLSHLASVPQDQLRDRVNEARTAGATWLEIATSLGMKSKQHAQAKFGNHVARTTLSSIAVEHGDRIVQALARHNLSKNLRRDEPIRLKHLAELLETNVFALSTHLAKSEMAGGRIVKPRHGWYALAPWQEE